MPPEAYKLTGVILVDVDRPDELRSLVVIEAVSQDVLGCNQRIILGLGRDDGIGYLIGLLPFSHVHVGTSQRTTSHCGIEVLLVATHHLGLVHGVGSLRQILDDELIDLIEGR